MTIALLDPSIAFVIVTSGWPTKVDPAKASLSSAQCSGDTSTHSRNKAALNAMASQEWEVLALREKFDFSLWRTAFKNGDSPALDISLSFVCHKDLPSETK